MTGKSTFRAEISNWRCPYVFISVNTKTSPEKSQLDGFKQNKMSTKMWITLYNIIGGKYDTHEKRIKKTEIKHLCQKGVPI